MGQLSNSLYFIGHHLSRTFTGTNRKGPNYQIGKTVLALAYWSGWLVIMTTQRLFCETARDRLNK